MEIRLLITFIEVANLKNFTKASKVLGYSQSNISAQIQQLEKDLGVTLFERMPRGVRLTQYAHELLPLAKDIVALSTKMGCFSQTEAEMEGVLRVGVVESIFNSCFESLLVNYAKRFPKIKLEITVDGTMTIEDLVLKNQLDLACTINELLPRTKWNCYYKEKVNIVIVAGINHPLAHREFVTPEELKLQTCIMMEDTSPYVSHFYHYLAMKGIVLEPSLSLQSSQMASRLIQKGNYISFLPEYTVRSLLKEGKIRILRLKGYDLCQNIQLVSQRKKVETRPFLGFIEEAKRALDNMAREL